MSLKNKETIVNLKLVKEMQESAKKKWGNGVSVIIHCDNIETATSLIAEIRSKPGVLQCALEPIKTNF